MSSRNFITFICLILFCTAECTSQVDTSMGSQTETSTMPNKPYTFPGIVTYKEGKWLGSDHLLNLPDHISIVVEIVGPENVNFPIKMSDIENQIKKAFEAAKITPSADLASLGGALPFFHLLLLIYNIPDGYVYTINSRLFEEVKLPRIILSEGVTMQAITWDRQEISVSPKSKFKEELEESINAIVNSFIERYKFFKTLPEQSK
jgi:hypothetical protein